MPDKNKQKEIAKYLNDPKRAVILVKKGIDPKKLKKLASHYTEDNTRERPSKRSMAVSPEMAALVKALEVAQQNLTERNQIIRSTQAQESTTTRSGRITQPFQNHLRRQTLAEQEVKKIENEIEDLKKKEGNKDKKDKKDDDDKKDPPSPPPPLPWKPAPEWQIRDAKLKELREKKRAGQDLDEPMLPTDALKTAAKAKLAHKVGKKLPSAGKLVIEGAKKGVKMGSRLNPIMTLLNALMPMIEREVKRKPPRGT